MEESKPAEESAPAAEESAPAEAPAPESAPAEAPAEVTIACLYLENISFQAPAAEEKKEEAAVTEAPSDTAGAIAAQPEEQPEPAAAS